MSWRYALKELALVIGAATPARSVSFHSVSIDTRTLKPGDVFFALRGERFDGADFVDAAFEKGACAVVAPKPASAGPCIVVADPLKALQAFAAYHRGRHRIPVFALTGSCGKTMAKDFTAAVLATMHTIAKTQGNLNNEIGCPLSLLQIDDDTDIAVIEMGANHAGEIAELCKLVRPTESAITMVAPAHLEGFGTVENVARAKGEIAAALSFRDTFYVNADDPWCVRIAAAHPGPTVRFGRRGDVALKACGFDRSGEMWLDIEPVGVLRLPLVCRAHATNVLLAVAVGLQHGIEEFEGPLREAITASPRFKLVQIGPLEVIDDSYNANPASMAAALGTLAERADSGVRIAALGEMLELGEAAAGLHRDVGTLAGQVGVTHLFVRGPHATNVVDAARAADVPHAEAIEDHEAIAEAICAVAQPGDTLLVKGSRGMAMENVIEALRRRYT